MSLESRQGKELFFPIPLFMSYATISEIILQPEFLT
jgi:hypothetical protein